jgi:hypothetical protein
MPMSKTYILQKDLPDSKAGDEFVLKSKNSDTYINKITLTQKSPVIEHNSYFKWQVENNPEWFLPKEEPEEYEILSFVFDTDGLKDIIKRNYDGSFGLFPGICEEYFLKSPIHKINSIKRLSDGKVFTVGDKINIGVIKSFEPLPNGIICVYRDNFGLDYSLPASLDCIYHLNKEILLRFYTEEEVLKIEEDAFNAGGQTSKEIFSFNYEGECIKYFKPKYPTFQDYKNSKIQNSNNESKD